MIQKKEISQREDIKLLVDTFYTKVRQDDVIGFIFNDIAKVNWPRHLPVMYDFWEMVLLGKPVYKGSPIPVHIALDKKVPLEAEHFARWKKLFYETLDELFEGEKVAEARRRVELIEPLMKYKVKQSRGDGFVQ